MVSCSVSAIIKIPLLQGSISEFCIFRYYLLIVSVLNSL
nr:MAG TPA: hypothetical protein [Caudoviricetes sp.]